MDKYNSFISRLFQPIPWKNEWAITLGQTTYFSCDSNLVDVKWHEHENEHKKQWKEDGSIKFICNYIWWNITRGYYKNPYEVDANNAEK
jgi:hypothetical protein